MLILIDKVENDWIYNHTNCNIKKQWDEKQNISYKNAPERQKNTTNDDDILLINYVKNVLTACAPPKFPAGVKTARNQINDYELS